MTTKANALSVVLALCLLLAVGQASAQNLLVNPGFESPSTAPGVEYYGAGDAWTSFGGGIFTVASIVNMPHGDSQSLKMFGGCCSGAY